MVRSPKSVECTDISTDDSTSTTKSSKFGYNRTRQAEFGQTSALITDNDESPFPNTTPVYSIL